jgi:hypothetical protein
MTSGKLRRSNSSDDGPQGMMAESSGGAQGMLAESGGSGYSCGGGSGGSGGGGGDSGGGRLKRRVRRCSEPGFSLGGRAGTDTAAPFSAQHHSSHPTFTPRGRLL